jgi:glutamine synthetase
MTPSIQFVRNTWVDNAGLTRAKARRVFSRLSPDAFEASLAFADQAMTAMGEAMAAGAGLDAVGSIRLVPDMDTLTIVPYASSSLRVMGDMYLADSPWELCPRRFLRHAEQRAQAMGLSIRAAFELEFYLLKGSPQELTPFDATRYGQSLAIDRADLILSESCEALEAQGVRPLLVHAESGPGQFEIALDHDTPLRTVDAQVIARDTLKHIAARHGFGATFLPKPLEAASGNGAHVHISLWKDQRNVTGVVDKPLLSDLGKSFVAGVLSHHDALLALCCPTVNSYRRLSPGTWSGGVNGWGYENRETAVRIPTDSGRRVTNIEYKPVDATCNPYLAMGALIWAGLDGIERKLSLIPESPPPSSASALTLDLSVNSALAALNADAVLKNALGAPLVRAYTAVRAADAYTAASMKDDDIVRTMLELY